MMEVKEIIVINNKRKSFIKKLSIKNILLFFKYIFKEKISNGESIYNYLANKYSIV